MGIAGVALRGGIVALTAATAAIHFSLGGLLFLANAAGYATLAVAMVLPIALFADRRWLVRVALMGFTATTIVGWLLIGPRFPLAYVDKAIEVALIALLTVEVYRYDGGPLGIARNAMELGSVVLRLVFGRRERAA
jgi:hypothetical protein